MMHASTYQTKMDACSAGNAFRHDFLRYGGAKDPKDLVEGVLGQNALQHTGGGFMPHVEGLLHHYGVMEVSQ